MTILFKRANYTNGGKGKCALYSFAIYGLFGTIKNVEIPVSQLEKALDNKMMFDGSSIEGFVRIEESDMYLYPDLDTFVVFPWTAEKGKVARLICDIYNPDGTPFAGDPRNNLKRIKRNGRTRIYRL